jgi:putative endopeptidase
MKKKTILISSVLIGLAGSAFVYNKLKGVDIAGINKSVKPQENFYEFANGNWIKNNPIPESESRWTAFNVVADRNNEILHNILKTAAASKADPSSAQFKVGEFYKIAMDTLRLEKQKFEALAAHVKRIDDIATTSDLVKEIAGLHLIGVNVAFGFDVSQDVKKSDRYSPYIAQAGLGLPDKDYYLKSDERSANIREAYVKYLRTFLGDLEANVGTSSVKKSIGSDDMAIKEGSTENDYGKRIIDFERQLAEVCMSRTERRNMEIQYNRFSIDELQKTYPNINFNLYFKHLGIKKEAAEYFIVMQPEFIARVNDLITVENLADWKLYLKSKLLTASAPYLHKDAVNKHFQFYATTLSGAKEQKPRWKTVIAQANGTIGELLGQEFVKVAFTPESKKRVNELVDHLSASFKERILKLEWMSTETKERALTKLSSFTRKLGYPDKWTDMSSLVIDNNFYVNNLFTANQFWIRHNLDKLGKPVDKTEWEMLPQTVNAYYNPVNNEIVFPAAIMQPPFFDPAADDAVNYGAIGAVIGHEFSHGFDDQGSKYDENGNLNDWWTAEDRKLFEERTKLLVQQFNEYQVLDGVFINGELTLGENIADFAGLTVAYDAYKRSLKGKKAVVIDGYNAEQRFFIGFAQVWKGHARQEFLRQQVVTDPHSPAQYRVIGTLSNMPEFYQAFGVKAGDKMHRDEANRVKIW